MRHSTGRLAAVAIAVGWIGSISPAPGQELPGAGQELARSPLRLETTTERPKAYGIQDYTVTVVPAIAFYPAEASHVYHTSGSLGRYGPNNTLLNFYAAIDLPQGAVVDYIGLNSTTDAPAALGVAAYRRLPNGTLQTVGTFSSTVHGWFTDYNASPFGYVNGFATSTIILHVQQGVESNPQFFGWVEVWWRRTVSAPFAQTFNDVPSDHPFYQFVEALAASGITVGCGSGNFCPDSPLTRGQMAVFLAKALGLHWGSQR
jgi:hypothetical protein